MPLNNVVHILRSLFIGRIEGIQHILLAIHYRLIADHAKLDHRQAFEVLFTTQKIDGGELMNPQLPTLLKPTILNHWDSYSDLEKIKIIYCYWNIQDWDDFKQLYSSIPITSDASMLYYFTQIEMLDPS